MDANQTPPTPVKRSLLRATAAGLPTLLVLGGIAAVGVWGHRSGWKAPKFAELLGRSATVDVEDWCTEHNVPDSQCIACHPELAGESAADWCKEHGVPESKCTVCHPEILETGVAGDWCAEHGLPESGCTICHPEIARRGELQPGQSDTTVSANGGSGSEAAFAGSVRDPRTCQKHALKVQFASAESVQKAGVRLGKVIERPMAESIAVNAEVDYDRTRFARLSSRVAGVAWSVEKALGSAVQAGEVLALVDSADAGRAKAELLQASTSLDARARTLERLQRSTQAGFRTEAERLEAEAAVREAESRLFGARQVLVNMGLALPEGSPTEASLRFIGLPESLAATLDTKAPSSSLVPIVAPFDGVLVSRELVAGDVVEPSRALFELADTRRMWVTMDVAQSDANRIELGQQVVFRADDARDEPALGSVSWISTSVDEMTRTLKVNAHVDNPGGTLRAGTFGRAQIVIRTSPNAIAVPSDSIQWEGCCYVVFVRLTDEILQTRKVRIGAKDTAYTEILAGVLPGEIVTTDGSHVLKSEILKSNLGAGCVDD